ncbi:MAG: Rrf2 family nitric oxide-sensitive transcriptional repressor [Glaciecola sp.]|jgi:Rrf2 family nitric oxide-sensitive transcriptional repressor
MQLTRHTDYGMRILIFLALLPKGERANIDTLSKAYDISRNNINKIVHQLGQAKIIETKRGKGGGFYLAREARDINVGEMVILMENSLEIIDCEKQKCVILPACRLKQAFNLATTAFLDTLKQFTLADLLADKQNALLHFLKLDE